MKLDLTKIANEPVGWILHGTFLAKRTKSEYRERIFQLTAEKLIESICENFTSYKEVYEHLGKLIKMHDLSHKINYRDPIFSLDKFVEKSMAQIAYLRCRELISKNYLGGKPNDSK